MYRHILIPTDGSELAERGVTHGLALAEIPWSQGIRNLRCGTVFRNDRAVPGGSRNICRAAQGAGHERVERAANAAKEVGISCKTLKWRTGNTHQAIIAAAEDKGCDLIVISSHGRSGLSMLLIGSVTTRC